MPGQRLGWPDYWNYRERHGSFSDEDENIEVRVSEVSKTSSPVERFAEDAPCATDARPSLQCSQVYVQNVEKLVMQDAPLLAYSKVCTILDERDRSPSKTETPYSHVADIEQSSAGASHPHVGLTFETMQPDLGADGTVKTWNELAGGDLDICASPRKYCLRCGRKDHELKCCTWFPCATLPPVKQAGLIPAWKR